MDWGGGIDPETSDPPPGLMLLVIAAQGAFAIYAIGTLLTSVFF